MSVEEGLAKTLGVKLGDRLRFDIAGTCRRRPHHQPAQGRLGLDAGQLLRHLPDCLDRRAAGELHRRLPRPGPQSQGAAFDNALAATSQHHQRRRRPSIAQVQGVLDQVIRAVEFLFGFTLAAGLVVLFAAVTATREARAREYAVMRAMGAGARLLTQVQRARAARRRRAGGCWPRWPRWRWAGAGALRLRVQLEPGAAGAAGRRAAGALLALAGWWGLREVLRRPVVETVRRAAE